MKKMVMMAAVFAAVAAAAVDFAVTPLKINALKEWSFDDGIVSGVSVPGGSIDFPISGKTFDASGFNCAVLTLEAVKDGICPAAPDMYLNLRTAKNGNQVHVVGAAGRNPGEVYFYFNSGAADINMMRLYLDAKQRYIGKKFAFKVKSLKFEKLSGGEVFLPYAQTAVQNCTDPINAAAVFGGKPKNSGCAVVFFGQPNNPIFKSFKFSKAEVGYTAIKGKLAEDGVEFNPRHPDGSSVEVRDPESSNGKFVFELDEPFTDFARIFFYFNRADALTGKEVQFKINYIVLIP